MTTIPDLTELRRIAEAATQGAWTWSAETDGWGDCGPNLETAERGPLYFDGSQGAAETIVRSWGHDANGISVEDADAEHIATFNPQTVLALLDRLERAEKTIAEAQAIFRPGASVPLGVSVTRHADRLMAEGHRILTAYQEGSTDE